MPTWKKSPPELVDAFVTAIANETRAERRQMFGYPCAFVNGNMAIGLHEDRLIARVPDEADQRPCIILGRRMRQYAALPYDDAMKSGTMAIWIERAVNFTSTLPPKVKAQRTAKSSRHAAKAAKSRRLKDGTPTAVRPKSRKTSSGKER